jgi:hypothetical protein
MALKLKLKTENGKRKMEYKLDSTVVAFKLLTLPAQVRFSDISKKSTWCCSEI